MAERERCDVAIIGGGHNGLVCAAYLARQGLDVRVFEKNDVAGGAALTEEFHPGFRNSVAAYTVSLLNPKVIADLDLTGHGLEIIKRPVANFWPVDAQRGLVLPNDTAGRQAAIAEFSRSDAEALPAYEFMLASVADLLRRLVLETPPNSGDGMAALISSVMAGRKLGGLAVDDKRDVIAMFTKSAADILDTYFEHPVVKGAFAFDAIVGAAASPRTPGTGYVLLHHCFGEVNGERGAWGHAIGGMGAVSEAIAAAARAAGARIEVNAAVSGLVADDGRAVSGVRLADGRVVSARAVASAVPPKLLARDLIPDGLLPTSSERAFRGIRSGSGTFRMNVALKELPDFLCRPGRDPQPHHGAGIVIGATLDYLERAYHEAQIAGWAYEPVVEMLIPSTIDPSLAPEGQHVASLFVQHVRPELPDGRSWANPAEREKFADVVINTVTRHAPNFRDAILARQILSPHDLEQRFGLIDGDIFHGQLGPDQLYSLRPFLGAAAYRLPVRGLYLCGSGAHPGGGVSGAPGHNAAREILKDLKRWF